VEKLELKNETINELLNAMDEHIELAYYLINKLITETIQNNTEEIKNGAYWMIENCHESNGLSENWNYDVHGEHCDFWNIKTGQKIVVSLGENKWIENVDPYFFYKYLETSDKYKGIAKYFEENPYVKMCDIFEKLEKEGKMQHLDRNEWKKVL
jgi:hypothetical protein